MLSAPRVESLSGSVDFAKLASVAHQQNADIVLARAHYDTAVAAMQTAGEKTNPTLALSPQIVTPLKHAENTYAIDFDHLIETGGKRESRVEAARLNAEAAGIAATAAWWKVRGALRTAWVTLAASAQKENLIKDQITVQQQIADALEGRVKAGEASPQLATRERLALNQLKLLQDDATKASATSKAAVAAAAGLSVSALADAKLSLPALNESTTIPSSETLRNKALHERPDVLLAVAEYAAAESLVQVELKQQKPDWHFTPGYQWDAGLHKWTVGFSLPLPIFHNNQGPIAEAEAKCKEAAAKVKATQATAIAELEQAEAGVAAAGRKLTTASQLLEAQDKQLKSAEALSKSGAEDKLSLATARLEHAVAATARLDAEIEHHLAIAALEAAVQSPILP